MNKCSDKDAILGAIIRVEDAEAHYRKAVDQSSQAWKALAKLMGLPPLYGNASIMAEAKRRVADLEVLEERSKGSGA